MFFQVSKLQLSKWKTKLRKRLDTTSYSEETSIRHLNQHPTTSLSIFLTHFNVGNSVDFIFNNLDKLQTLFTPQNWIRILGVQVILGHPKATSFIPMSPFLTSNDTFKIIEAFIHETVKEFLITPSHLDDAVVAWTIT